MHIYSKGTPMHVRGTLLYNHLVKKYSIDGRYPVVKDGEKIKFLHVKVPNPIQENIISFLVTLPKEFGLHKYVDYDLQFEKSFLEPLKFIVESINWKI